MDGIRVSWTWNVPTNPGPREPKLWWPGATGNPVSTPLKFVEPGKSATQGAVRFVGVTVAVPEMTNVPLVVSQDVMSRLSWQVKPLPAGV